MSISLDRQNLNRLNRITIVAKDLSNESAAKGEGKTDQYYVDLKLNESGADWCYFTAYLNNNISMAAQNDFGDLLAGAGVNDLLAIAANKGGFTPAFSMNRALTYKGASPVSLSLDCTLKAFDDGKDYKQSIIEPIQTLAKIAFPGINTDSSGQQTTLRNFAGQLASEWGRSESSVNQFLAYVADGADKLINWICENVDIIGNIADSTKFLALPVSLKAPVAVYYGNPDNNVKTTPIKLGPFYLKSVSISLGKLIISPGLPEIVNVQVGLESSRTTDAEMFKKLININV